MAVNFPTYTDAVAANRPPIMGDIRKRTDYNTWTDIVEIFNGTDWQDMKVQESVTKTTNGNFSITSIPAPAGNYAAVSTAATTIKNDVVTMIEKNIRVAEVYDTKTQKLKRAELQFREGPGSVWEPIQRVKLYE
jgi:hypothetical protein